ncbi:hypothetical protein K435DRAFT_873060 [Dendrothele bispora CBS 962.96]|uniref:Uncharacterized protein n=1 Tax=Dendrothele bispora (strain CBS 962.96) TaxID=1314807 RepID=A0A4S8L013_DENBC|nr:hypothetical protein K435DRAFT_873060 [Dendrothele bispora CBS 962.96]
MYEPDDSTSIHALPFLAHQSRGPSIYTDESVINQLLLPSYSMYPFRLPKDRASTTYLMSLQLKIAQVTPHPQSNSPTANATTSRAPTPENQSIHSGNGRFHSANITDLLTSAYSRLTLLRTIPLWLQLFPRYKSDRETVDPFLPLVNPMTSSSNSSIFKRGLKGDDAVDPRFLKYFAESGRNE